jgi:hypothetical protein
MREDEKPLLLLQGSFVLMIEGSSGNTEKINELTTEFITDLKNE